MHFHIALWERFGPFFSEGANCAADLMRRGQPDRLAALSKATRRGPVGIYILGRTFLNIFKVLPPIWGLYAY